MVDSATDGDAGNTGDAAVVARDFRVSLEHRRDIDDLVAEAVAIRQRANVEATEIVRNAEDLARVILADARTEADRMAADAARITAEAEQALEAASAQQTLADAALGEQVSATIGRLESMASDVQMVLDSALAEVADSLGPLADHPQHDRETGREPESEQGGGSESEAHGGAGSEPDERPESTGPTGHPDQRVRTAAEQRFDRWRERLRQAR